MLNLAWQIWQSTTSGDVDCRNAIIRLSSPHTLIAYSSVDSRNKWVFGVTRYLPGSAARAATLRAAAGNGPSRAVLWWLLRGRTAGAAVTGRRGCRPGAGRPYSGPGVAAYRSGPGGSKL